MSTQQVADRKNEQSLMGDALDHCIVPLMPMAEVRADGPIILAEGAGVVVRDQNGKEYLDMMSSLARANSGGYGNDEIATAMYEQARRMHYAGTVNYMTEPMIRLATKIASLTPANLTRAVFTSGGSRSVEAALKLAKQYQQSGPKPKAFKTISRWNAYHGSTMGALSCTDWLAVRDVPDPRVPGHSFVASPMCYRNPYGMSEENYAEICVKHLERQIQLEGPDLVAAFIGEPIMQANGVQIPPKAYWPAVREVCTKYGVMMIVDEVICGFGRTGDWFASLWMGIEPDIMTSAKALTAGYVPMGAVVTRPEIADAIAQYRHVHTFSGHAVAAAVANKVIEIKERDGLIKKVRADGQYVQEALEAAIGDHPIVGQVRGVGAWHAVDFTPDKRTRAAFTDNTVKAIAQRMKELGVIVSAIGTAFEFAPPYIATREQLDRTIEVASQAIREVSKARGLG